MNWNREEFQKIATGVREGAGVLRVLEGRKKYLDDAYGNSMKEIEALEKAQRIIQTVAKQTVTNLEVHFSDIGSLAIASVFPYPVTFKAVVELRRGQVEIDTLFEEFGKSQKPEGSSGGGIVDVADYALVIACWVLDQNRPTIIFDEPFRNVSPSFHKKLSEMVKAISEDFGLQQIIISHSETVNIKADRTINVRKTGKVSEVTVE